MGTILGLAGKRKKNNGTVVTKFKNGGTATVSPAGTPAASDIPSASGLLGARDEALKSSEQVPIEDQPYSGPDAASMNGLMRGRASNGDVQALRQARFAGRMQNEAVARERADREQRMQDAQTQAEAGNLTVDSASRMGLLGAKSRYSKDFTIIGPDGTPMKTDAGGYVAHLNSQKVAQNEAEKNRSSAEAIANSKNAAGLAGANPRLSKVVTLKTTEGNEIPLAYDEHGQIIKPNDAPDFSQWSPEDAAEYAKLVGYNKFHSSKISAGKGDKKYRNAEKGDTNSAAFARNKARMNELMRKYSGAGPASQRPGSPADPDVQTPPAVVPPNQKQDGLLTLDAFIADYTKEFGVQPTKSRIEEARGKYWR